MLKYLKIFVLLLIGFNAHSQISEIAFANRPFDIGPYVLQVSDSEKIRLIKMAEPDTLTGMGDYFYHSLEMQSYDTVKDEIVYCRRPSILCKLARVYIIDINNDGYPDIVHYGVELRYDHQVFIIYLSKGGKSFSPVFTYKGKPIHFVFNQNKLLEDFTVYHHGDGDMPDKMECFKVSYHDSTKPMFVSLQTYKVSPWNVLPKNLDKSIDIITLGDVDIGHGMKVPGAEKGTLLYKMKKSVLGKNCLVYFPDNNPKINQIMGRFGWCRHDEIKIVSDK